jgi:hypothetical protein
VGATGTSRLLQLAYVYSCDDPAVAMRAGILTDDEARRVAVNIARKRGYVLVGFRAGNRLPWRIDSLRDDAKGRARKSMNADHGLTACGLHHRKEVEMSDDNKLNLLYFERPSVRELYGVMDAWQKANRKRFHSVNIQKDGDSFCCIALTNPTEVVITDEQGYSVQVFARRLAVVPC